MPEADTATGSGGVGGVEEGCDKDVPVVVADKEVDTMAMRPRGQIESLRFIYLPTPGCVSCCRLSVLPVLPLHHFSSFVYRYFMFRFFGLIHAYPSGPYPPIRRTHMLH